jgi:Bacterial regulatory proteins, tetR family
VPDAVGGSGAGGWWSGTDGPTDDSYATDTCATGGALTAALVGEVGYARMTVERVVRLSGISRETFHRCFEDLDDWFICVR